MKKCFSCGHRFEADHWHCPDCGRHPKSYNGFTAFASDQIKNSDGFDNEFFALLAEVEPGHFWFESRNRLILWALREFFPEPRDFLEIGCGTGFVLSGIRREFPELSLIASDIFTEGFTYAQARIPDAEFFQMDARHIPFEHEFDVIGAFDILEHIVEDEAVLVEMFQATKPGGGIILTVPQHPFLWSYFDELSHHQRRYTRLELLKKVEQVGFKIIHSTSFISLLLPLLLLSRLRHRQLKNNYDLREEFNNVGILNTLLTRVLDLERALIKRGFSFPLGGSLLVVAKR